MNNNRQPNNSNNNRRRGRSNNNRPQGNNQNRSGFDYQNLIDNRARGNASQMLEKYKKMASDAQHNDDRVNVEYYLQFADHYFRVLADFRSRQEARQEERRPQRDDNQRDLNPGDESRSDYGNMQEASDSDFASETVDLETGDIEQERAPRQDRSRDHNERKLRRERTQPRTTRRHHCEESDDSEAGGLDLAVLPPSISMSSAVDGDEPAAKPVRKPRARKPKTEDISAAAE